MLYGQCKDWLISCRNIDFMVTKWNLKLKNGKLPMSNATYSRFIRFLQDELAVSTDSLAIAQRSGDQSQGQLPMILWQYGLITLKDLDRIYDWLEGV